MRIKQQGTWYYPYRTLVKRNGVWKDDYLRGIRNNLYNGTVGVGSHSSSYVAYGYSASVFGSTNNIQTKFINEMAALVTGSKPYYNAPPYQWLEMVIVGDVRHIANQLGDITINGNYGRLVNIGVGSSSTNRTFIGWVFDKPLPTTGQWNINS